MENREYHVLVALTTQKLEDAIRNLGRDIGECLKAQAIAARSESMKKLGRHKNEGCNFCAEVHCQSYTGVEQETENSTKAVDATRGIVMFYEGKPIDAVYSSNCGGHTQGNVFGDQKSIPYWQPRFDSLARDSSSVPFDPFELD